LHIDIDQETRQIFGTGGNYKIKTLYEKARENARGKNLITALYPNATQKPTILIIDAESAKRTLLNEIGIWKENVIVVNLCPDDQTRWNNLYNRKYSEEKIIRVMRESPTTIDPEALNIDNSLCYRLNEKDLDNILRRK